MSVKQQEVYAGLFAMIQARSASALKRLLETRHLYQKEPIDVVELIKAEREKLFSYHPGNSEYYADQLERSGINGARFILSPNGEPVYARDEKAVTCPALSVRPLNVKIFCRNCGCREGASPLHFSSANPIELQLFLLVFQCHLCRNGSVSFLVKQDKWTFSIHGRSPFEELELPASIPKAESAFFRDAVISYDAGKTLAALFYLRTFIEQFGRRQTGIGGKENGAVILGDYGKTIPEDLRSRMPSLASAYDELSTALHSANDDAFLFEKIRVDVVQHFDVRKVHKLLDGPVPAVTSK